MNIIITLLASVLVSVWIYLLFQANDDDWMLAAYGKVMDNRSEITKLREKDYARERLLQQTQGIAQKALKCFYGKGNTKKIEKLEEQNEQIQAGNFKSVSVAVMPGFVLQRKINKITSSDAYKKILETNIEMFGKKHAEKKTKQIIAKILSYTIIGLALVLAVGIILMKLNTTAGVGVMAVGVLLVLVLAYAQYDDVSSKVVIRRESISRQYPNVLSKLALLVTSGMIMDKAWRETAESRDDTLYLEMRRTADELDNLVGIDVAFGNFIDRCNTKETAKLASAIIQNQSKGNAEIGLLLKEMAKEAWIERKNMAKRDSEKANSKLMIPTMMIFISILIIIMVPIFMNFTGI